MIYFPIIIRPIQISLILIIVLVVHEPFAQISADGTHSFGGRTPSLLPLVLSTPKFSSISINSHFGRHLQRDFLDRNAHMRLHDDLLTSGYYTTRLWIGTPPQEFALIVDSGSSVTYVPCSSCEQCGKHQDPSFQPDMSTTYQAVKCNIDCNCDESGKVCTYERHYAEMSSSSGVLGEDVISFGNESSLEIQRVIFGCENSETGDLFSQHADGIMGLGRGQLSIVDQLVGKGVINDSFSLCYGGMDVGGGAMALGEIPLPPDMVFSHSDPSRSPYYNIELKEINIGGTMLQLNPMMFNMKHGTVLDSGTTYAYLPEKVFIAFRDTILAKVHHLKIVAGPDPNYNDICLAGAGRDASHILKTFPRVELVFSTGQKLSLDPENYLFRHSKIHGGYCLGVFQNGKDPTTLLGGIIVRNTLVTYDRRNERIGFWKTNCSLLWESLNISNTLSPGPIPSSASKTGSNESVALPPSSSDHVVPGEFHIGAITFDMSLDMRYHDLEPQVSRLAGYIARELNISKHQVNLLNSTTTGNGTIMRWVILPSGSSIYISNSTAKRIITSLTTHNVHLPDMFGNYQLVELKVEPPGKRLWWQHHILGLVVGAIVAGLLFATTLAIWHVWKSRHEFSGRYRPVDAPSGEQELQPL